MLHNDIPAAATENPAWLVHSATTKQTSGPECLVTTTRNDAFASQKGCCRHFVVSPTKPSPQPNGPGTRFCQYLKFAEKRWVSIANADVFSSERARQQSLPEYPVGGHHCIEQCTRIKHRTGSNPASGRTPYCIERRTISNTVR